MFFEGDTRKWMRYTSVGLEFTLTFLMGLGLGYWLDKVHGPSPAYLLSFGAIGFGVGLYRLIRQALDIRNENVYKPPHEKRNHTEDS